MGLIAINNARIISSGRITRTNIVVENGKVKRLTKSKLLNVDRSIDAHGLFALPGLVDGHAHLYDPAYTNREDFTSGTTAAAAGGVTSVIEMVLSTPVDSAERVKKKIDEGIRSSLIDFSLHAGMMNAENLPNIPSIVACGVRSFKTFTCKPYMVDDHTLTSLMRETSREHAILVIHSEDEETANINYEKLVASGRKDPIAHCKWRPNEAEERAVRKIAEYAADINARVHIAHMSTAESTAIVRNAKRAHVRITAETCPHYLTFTRKDMKNQGPYLKMNPSLKGPRDVQALWKGLRDGSVDIVTSEHAPGERAEKEAGWSDIWKAWGGVPAIETMLPVMLSEGVNKKRITIQQLQRVCCEKPARIFGVYPKKGAIMPGADADFVLVDLKLKRKVRAEELHSKVGWTPYERWPLTGWPTLTICRGRVVYEDGQVTGRLGSAEFLPMSL